jgi:predicted Kef-type K+ transport protein
MLGTPLSALGAALSPRVGWLIVSSIFMFAFLGAAIASGIVMLAEELAVDDRAKGQSYAALAGSLGAGLCILVMPRIAPWHCSRVRWAGSRWWWAISRCSDCRARCCTESLSTKRAG